MPVNYTQYRFYSDLIQFGFSCSIGFYVWYSNRLRVNHKRFTELERKVEKKISALEVKQLFSTQAGNCKTHQAQTRALEQTTARLGAEIRALPTSAEIKDLNDGLSRLYTKMAHLEGQFAGVDRLTSLLNEFMLTQGKVES